MTTEITDRQRAFLETIYEQFRNTGQPPSVRELGDLMGLSSTNAVGDYITALVRKGYIVRGRRGHSRNISLVERWETMPLWEVSLFDEDTYTTFAALQREICCWRAIQCAELMAQAAGFERITSSSVVKILDAGVRHPTELERTDDDEAAALRAVE